MAERAARSALDDAGIPYAAVQQAYAGYVYGDSTAGQCALYSLGLSAIPVVNVNNNCSTGSSALWLARQAVASGAADCVLAVGFEQMRPGALGSVWDDRPDPLRRLLDRMTELQGFDERIPVAAQLFGGAGVAYTDKYGTDPATFAKIAVKARRHAAGNPYAVFRAPLTEDEVLALAAHLWAPDPAAVLPTHLWGRRGGALKFVLDGDNTYGGKVVTNPSGGLLSKGHPLGATGLAQCAELAWQLRGQADARQVEDVTTALQHNIGLGGACVVTLYEKAP